MLDLVRGWLDLLPLALAFSKPKMPAVAPAPATPVDDSAAKAERVNAANAAAADLASRGRAQSVFAGNEIALNEAQKRTRLRNERAAEDLLL